MLFFICFNIKSQIIIDTNTYYKYPKIEKYIDFYSEEDTLEVYYEKKGYVVGEHNKVGQHIEYYFDGKIRRMGYWNSKNDTFC